MSVSDPHVVIVGGGLAGPCLAHGLRRAGFLVSLYERDEAVDRGQGYRIHIDPSGDRALRACLPPHLYELCVATSGVPGSGVSILNGNLEVIHRIEVGASAEDASTDPGGHHLTVDRLTLRRVLLAELDGSVHFGGRSRATRTCPTARSVRSSPTEVTRTATC
ncbi:MAG: NAD(P)-binding protein [Streptosporangiales bacterium]|nr:NAD(P)-binding protein [Streptosporangiales bacterium]